MPTLRSADDQVPLVGVLTGTAKEINRLKRAGRFSLRERDFLDFLLEATFGDAGLHRKWGRERPGTWCRFNLAVWCAELRMSKSQVCHLRAKLADAGVIRYDASEERVEWNLNFAEWQPLQSGYDHRGGRRPGAGAPVGNQNARGPRIQASVDNFDCIGAEAGPDSIKPVNGNNQSRQRKQSNSSTLASSEAGPEAAPEAAIRMEELEETIIPIRASAPTREATPAAAASSAPAPAYDSTPRQPRRVAELPPKLAAEVQPILDTLRDGAGWRSKPNDEALLIGALNVRPLPWVHRQALKFAATSESRDGRKQPHTMQAFMGWLIGDTADRMFAEYEARQRELQTAKEQPATPATPTPKRQGERPNAKRSQRPAAPAAAARAGATPAGPRVSTGYHTNKRPHWAETY